MAWTTPKTDWAIRYDENGEYLGDFLNVEDYNRICGNLQHIKNEFIDYNKPNIDFKAMEEITIRSLAYASQWNAIEENLEALIKGGSYTPIIISSGKRYVDNGRTIDYTELNRIESLSLQIHELLEIEYKAQRQLEFSLGLDNIGEFSTLAGGNV